MKCQILFSGKNKKNIIILSSAENAQRVVKVKEVVVYITCFLLSAKQTIHSLYVSKQVKGGLFSHALM